MAEKETTAKPSGEKATLKEPEKTAKNISDDLIGKKPAVEVSDKDKAKTPEKTDIPPASEKAETPPIPDIKGDKAVQDKTPAKDGADKPEPGNGAKIPGITFIQGKEQAAAEKKEPEATKTDTDKKDTPTPTKDEQGEKAKNPSIKEKQPKEKQTRAARPPDGSKRGKVVAFGGGISGTGTAKEATQPEPPQPPPPPRDATRPGDTEQIVYIDHAELYPFKDHPFQVRDDEAMKTLVESVKERGVDQPALVRPREGGGYELVAGHRRQHASELAGLKNVPCVVRNMTDEEAVLAMAESNFNQRSEILASERAKALKMQLDAIKRQGDRFKGVASGDVGKRSNEIIAERNGMNYKTVQRYIALNNLTPELMKFVDDGKVKFIPAVELSYIKPDNQRYIAMSIDGDAPAPSQDQAKRMRELDQKKVLNYDVIDGIMLEENRKDDIKVVLNSQELGKYFGPEKSPAEMKADILKALDEWKEKQPLDLGKTDKKKDDKAL